MDLPKRKPTRLKNYNYNTTGAYFITICVKDRLPMLSTIPVGATIGRPIKPVLKKHGIIVEKAIKKISQRCSGTITAPARVTARCM